MKPSRTLAAVFLLLIASAVIVNAKPLTKRKFARTYTEVKGTKLDACATCHVGNGTELNVYGKALKAADEDFASIEKADADDDGASNLDEIKALTFPGDPKDAPGGSARDSSSAKPDSAKADSTGKKKDGGKDAKPDSTRGKGGQKEVAPPAAPKNDDPERGPRLPWWPGFSEESGG